MPPARLEGARLQAAGSKAAGRRLHLQGCRLHGCKLPFANYKGSSVGRQNKTKRLKRGHALGAQRQLPCCRQRDARLQASGCGLQGCRLQGCRPQVAGCKGLRVGAHSACSGSFKAAGSRIQSCRARHQLLTCQVGDPTLQQPRSDVLQNL